MSFLKKTGSILGEAAGFVTGEPIKFIGKKLSNDYIQEIGDGVRKASTNTGKTIGSIADGTWNTASGIINKDKGKRDQGLNELKTTAVHTAKGVGQSVQNTFINGKDLIQGAATNNKEQLIKGAKGIGKTAAVATIAVGVLDVLDIVDVFDADGNDGHVHAETVDSGTDLDNTNDVSDHAIHMETRNETLADDQHPVTGVDFDSKVVTLPSGEQIEGVFPEFESDYTVTIPESMYLESDDTQFSYATESLAEQINQDPSLGSNFTDAQLQQIFANQTPEGYIWHHSEEPGQLELVDEEIHEETGHTGGRELWGGGTENR